METLQYECGDVCFGYLYKKLGLFKLFLGSMKIDFLGAIAISSIKL